MIMLSLLNQPLQMPTSGIGLGWKCASTDCKRRMEKRESWL